MGLPPSSERVSDATTDEVNQELRAATRARIRHYASNPDEIDERLEELDREWDIERVLETNASALALVGLGLGTFVDRRWYALPAGVLAFLLQHALQGWCPPVPVFRRMGVRTAREIETERHALKFLRGDYDRGPATGDASHDGRAERALRTASA